MRTVLSYLRGIVSVLSRLAAPLIIVILGIWFLTGNIIEGGHGPGKGSTAAIAFVEPKGGKLTDALEKSGVQAKPEDDTNGIDPALTIAQRDAKTEGAAAPARSVEVKTFLEQAMPIEVDVRGQTKAFATVTASAETTGTVNAVKVQKGDTVKAGDLLCQLDPETRQAAVAQAQAGLAQAQAAQDKAQADADTNQTLISKGAATPNSQRALDTALVAAKANVAAAQAGLDNAKTELGRTNIVAKSGGIVADPLASVGTMLAAGQPCATIVQLDPILFAGAVPEARINYARLGLPATIATVTGDKLTGKVTYIAPVADAATRTFPVEIQMDNPGSKVPSGLTATATVNVGTAPAQLLPQSVLTLDDNGAMGVRAVGADNKVVFYPVTIIKDAREGMYVTGLPPSVNVITVGQEFVKAGDLVKPVQASTTDSASSTGETQGVPS